jgi:hypothetical protein
MKKPLLPKSILIPRVPELATKAHEGTPQYGDYGHPSTAPAPVLPSDRRAEGGNVFDLINEQTTL